MQECLGDVFIGTGIYNSTFDWLRLSMVGSKQTFSTDDAVVTETEDTCDKVLWRAVFSLVERT